MTGGVPVVHWGDGDTAWLAARREGISASDIAAVLGFGPYRTPWEVWADKTSQPTRTFDATREYIRLGVALEPWLLAQAGHILGSPARRTAARLYAHPRDRWQLCSPDGQIDDDTGIEAKTAGLASGYGIPDGWTDTHAPLGYELQCRWVMRVRGYQRMVLVALVAGLGLRTYTYERDLDVEVDMVAQVSQWRERHLVRGEEPPMTAADNQIMDATHPATTGGEIRLDGVDGLGELLAEYATGLAHERDGRARREAATAQLKRLLGDHGTGTVTGEPVVTWNTRRGQVDWPALTEDLVEIAGWTGPLLDMETLLDQYRKPSSRSINVKGHR